MGRWLFGLLVEWKDRFTPYTSWIGQLKNPEVIKADIMAGIAVALVLIPQSMAYAQLAGLPPYIGLYAAFLPVIVAALFGSSHQLATGPVAVVSLMSAAAMQPYASQGPEALIAYSSTLALLVGVIQLSLGLFRLGILVDFLSHPVVIGFTNAGSIIIATSQLPKIFGLNLKADQFEHSYEFWWATLQAIPNTNWIILAMGGFSLLSLFLLKRYAPRLPGVLITVILATLISWAIGYNELGGSIVGKIPEGLPKFSLPQVQLDFDTLTRLAIDALVIGLIGFVEAISIAKAIASQTRQRLSANQELVGQGLANLVSGLSGAYTVSGSFSRSAVNFTAGAVTGLSSVVTGILTAITLLFLTPLLYYLPQATLAAIIIMAVVNLFKVKPIKHAWKVEPHDGIVAVVTLLSTLVFAPHLDKGIFIGVLLSLGLFLYRTMRPNLVEVARDKDGTMRDAKIHGLQTSETVAVYRFDGDLYFANAGYLEGRLLNNIADKPKLKVLILDMESVDRVDSTGEETLEKLADYFKSAGIEFYIARLKYRVYEALKRSGLVSHIGEGRFFRERKHAIEHAKSLFGEAIDVEPLRRYMPLSVERSLA